MGELSEFKNKVPRRLPGTQRAPLTLYLNHCLWTDVEAGLTKQHVRVSLKSPSEPRGLAFPLAAGWALYPQTLLSTPAASRSQLRLYSADEKSGASGSQPGNTSPSSGTGRIPTQAQALKVAIAQPTLWPGSKVWSMREFTWRPTHSPRICGSPGWRRLEQGAWEGAGIPEPTLEPDRADVSAEREELCRQLGQVASGEDRNLPPGQVSTLPPGRSKPRWPHPGFWANTSHF